MAIWPFHRKSERKRSRSGATQSDAEAAPPARSHTTDDSRSAARSNQKKQRTDLNKLHRRSRTYSFSPDRDDSIRVGREEGSSGRVLPNAKAELRPSRRRSRRSSDKLEEAGWQPTLHSKTSLQQLPLRKTSKRRRQDRERAAEIKAMSNFMPVRPATDSWTAGRPTRKESKRLKAGFGLSKTWEDPSSDISLPIPDSLHSSMSSDSDHASYKLNRLDSLAPRPTLRYTIYPRWGPPTGSVPTRTSSQKRKLSDRPPISEATLRAHKRIDELADDLSASDLRELMERDRRRRDRKRQKEQEKAERRLARKAERQEAAEAAAKAKGMAPPPNLERGVLGRELVGLGIDATSAVVTSSKVRSSDDPPALRAKEPESPDLDIKPKPTDHFHRMASMPLEPAENDNEKFVATPQSQKHKGLLKLKRSRSRTSLEGTPSRVAASPPPATIDERELPRKSAGGGSKARRSLSGLFKWGNKSKRSSSSVAISSTSREEMSLPQPPTVELPNPPIASTSHMPVRRLSSGVPKRMKSRFKEDLPDIPMSPPESREPSPKDNIQVAASKQQETERSSPIPTRFDTPTSGHRLMDETMHHTPTSWHQDNSAPSPQPHSISLASIDSEASWLSGRLTGRRSAGLRSNQHARTASRDTGSNSADDDRSIIEDEYLSRLTPPMRTLHSSANPVNRKSAGEPRPSSDEDEPVIDADMRWGSVKARRHATLVPSEEHGHNKVKSREGLLNSYPEEGEGDSEDEPDAGGSLQRATSINLGKGHARHISAGSAKILEISPRGSIDSRRRSSAVFI